MSKKLFYTISAILLILVGRAIWYYNNPESIASSNSGCFRFFNLTTPSKDHCVDYLYSQGRKWEDFGSKIYYLDNFSDDELASISEELIAHGATRSDSVISLTARRGNIEGTFRLFHYPELYQVVVYFQQIY